MNPLQTDFVERGEPNLKARKLKDGDMIEVGDYIRIENYLGVSWQAVHRVTKRYAFVKWNEKAEGKFKREYKEFGFDEVPYKRWNTTRYSAWRPIPEECCA